MPQAIFTDSQVKKILERVASIGEWKHVPNLERRKSVSKELKQKLSDLDVANDETVDRKSFCEMVGLQWKIQNLSPFSMPELLGSYHYKKHFGGFEGTEEEFVNLQEKETGSRDIYPGADLKVVSTGLRLMLSNKHDDRAKGVELLKTIRKSGDALASGFLYLIYPNQFGIVNAPTREAFLAKGWIGVTGEQRKAATSLAKSRLSNADLVSNDTFNALLKWFEIFREVKEICQLPDYHEVDQLLWYLSSGEESKDKVDFAELMSEASTANLEVRVKSEKKARGIIEENIGNLTADQTDEVFNLMNACHGKNGVVFNRFGPAFVGNNVKKVFENLDDFNRLVEQLWIGGEDDIANLLNQFWASDSLGKSKSLPSLILYLRDNKKFGIWTDKLDKALYRVTMGLPSKSCDGYSYLQYCQSLQHLRDEVGFEPELHDWILYKLIEKTPKKSKKAKAQDSKFQGFSDDTFKFLEDLENNNTDTWFKENKVRFTNEVDKPLRYLIGDVGRELVSQLDDDLQISPKTGKCMSKIRKNIYGKKDVDCYNGLYWAAYYRRDRTKNTDCQLFMSLWPGRFTTGFYIGHQADDVRERFVENLKKLPDYADAIVAKVYELGLQISGKETENEPVVVDIKTGAQLVELIESQRIHIFRSYSPEQAVAHGLSLKELVKTDIEFLYKLFKIATSKGVDASEIDFGGDNKELDPDHLTTTIADLCDQTYLEPEFFEKLDLYLEDKQQLIFHGPPGTGKTFVALKYAEYLTQDEGDVKVVQFHPSYGYEDFIEGLRPSTDSKGHLSYTVEPGIFKRLCETARSTPKSKFVLIIDEINRGNIPRIFGELMFLLENRGQSTDLPFSKKPFSIPRNIVVIGTMNSTDRSVALMDLALRRRFHFVSMDPRKDVLLSWLSSQGKSKSVANLFARLNESLGKDGVEAERLVGHAHFMSQNLSDEFLQLIWEGTIEPLVNEYFFADPDKTKRYAYDKFASELGVDDEDEADGDEDDLLEAEQGDVK